VSEDELITSTRRAAAVCGVTRFAVRGWIDRGLLPGPPWTVPQLERTRDAAGLRPGPQSPHGTRARWSHDSRAPNLTSMPAVGADTLALVSITASLVELVELQKKSR
jgi:hypothetical protein